MIPRFLALAFGLLSVPTFAAEAPADFAGIKWGASHAEANAAMVARGAVPQRGSDEQMNFSGGNFNGQPAAGFALRFVGGGLQGGLVRLPVKGEGAAAFRKLKSELNDQYGTANDVQVGPRKAAHFVFGLGWRSGGVNRPNLSAEWSLTSGIKPRTVAIHLWLAGGELQLAYGNQTMVKAAAPATGPATMKKKGDL